MKILVIPSWYPSKSYPNNGSFFKEQSEALRNSGHYVDTFVLDVPYRNTKKDFEYFKVNKYEENGINVYRAVYPVGFLRKMPGLFYMAAAKIAITVFRKYLLENAYDAIIAHSSVYGGYVASEIGEKFDIPVITIEHSSKILLNQLNSKEKEIVQKTVRKSSCFVCVSNNLRKCVCELTKTEKDILVHPNMVSSIFHAGRKSEDEFNFVSIGNLIPLKQMDKLIEGFCDAFSGNDKVHLTIIGDGPEAELLKEMIEKENMQKQISLTGRLDRAEVAAKLASSNAMVLISSHETFGIAYIEALACGNVVLGYNNGGANDIINKENGIIIESTDRKTVSDALLQIYNRYDEFNYNNIAESACAIYSENVFSEYYTKLIEAVC